MTADTFTTQYHSKRFVMMIHLNMYCHRKANPSQKRLPFTHPAIREAIIDFFFPKKSNHLSLTTIDLAAFDPIPLPTIALISTVVSYIHQLRAPFEILIRSFTTVLKSSGQASTSTSSTASLSFALIIKLFSIRYFNLRTLEAGLL